MALSAVKTVLFNAHRNVLLRIPETMELPTHFENNIPYSYFLFSEEQAYRPGELNQFPQRKDSPLFNGLLMIEGFSDHFFP